MASLSGTRAPTYRIRNFGLASDEGILKTSEVFYINGYYAIEEATGTLTEPADAAGLVPKGIIGNFGDGTQALDGSIGESVTGDAAAAVPPRAKLHTGGFVVEFVPVAGVTGDLTDVGTEVYLYTDNIGEDLTISAGATDTRAKGVIEEFHTATSYTVRFYSADVIAAK